MYKKGFVTGKMAPTEITRRDGEEEKRDGSKIFFFILAKKTDVFNLPSHFCFKNSRKCSRKFESNIIASTLAEREREPFSDVNPFKTADRREQH